MKDMKDIVDWLRVHEQLANEIYLTAVSIYSDDPKLKNFLEHMAKDEAWHYHVMGSAADYLASKPSLIPIISVDTEVRNKITHYLSTIKNGLDQNNLSKDDLIEKIVELEFSEWNDIFVYVVNVLKEKVSAFKYTAALIQRHLKAIEYYFEKAEILPETYKKLTTLSSVWDENILIVDDDPLIANLLKALLARSGNIDIAQNGEEALKLINKKYYKLVVSDVHMPIMDGFSLFMEASARFPSLISRFVFITGDPSTENQAFFMKNKVKHLEKPIEIKSLRDTTSEILLSR